MGNVVPYHSGSLQEIHMQDSEPSGNLSQGETPEETGIAFSCAPAQKFSSFSRREELRCPLLRTEPQLLTSAGTAALPFL